MIPPLRFLLLIVNNDTTVLDTIVADTVLEDYVAIQLLKDTISGGFYRALVQQNGGWSSDDSREKGNSIIQKLNDKLELLWADTIRIKDDLPTSFRSPDKPLILYDGGVVAAMAGSIDSTDFYNNNYTTAMIISVSGDGAERWRKQFRVTEISNFLSRVAINGENIVAVGVYGHRSSGDIFSAGLISQFNGVTGEMVGCTRLGVPKKDGTWVKSIVIEGDEAWLAGYHNLETYSTPHQGLLMKVNINHEILKTNPTWVKIKY